MRILIEVQGGIIVNVSADAAGVEYVVLDSDVEGLADGDALVNFRDLKGDGFTEYATTHADAPVLDAGVMASIFADVDAPRFQCQDCGARWLERDLKEVQSLQMRVAPGEPMPAGECPDCGALCHEDDEDDEGPVAT